jgi:hypothetical protein
MFKVTDAPKADVGAFILPGVPFPNSTVIGRFLSEKGVDKDGAKALFHKFLFEDDTSEDRKEFARMLGTNKLVDKYFDEYILTSGVYKE